MVEGKYVVMKVSKTRVRAGIPVVEEKHTWIRRAHQLLEWIEEDARGTDRKD